MRNEYLTFQKIFSHCLINVTIYPLSSQAINAFNLLKTDMESVAYRPIDEGFPFVVECYASETTLSATLNQGGRPVAFMSRTLQGSEMHYPPVDKDATAIIEAVREWEHLLVRKHFTIFTDQRYVDFMLNNRKRTKIKNNKIHGWRLALASVGYTITYGPGTDNVEPTLLLVHLVPQLQKATQISHIYTMVLSAHTTMDYGRSDPCEIRRQCQIICEFFQHIKQLQTIRYLQQTARVFLRR